MHVIWPLSLGGNEVFIKSVLQAIPTFAMSCFLLHDSFYAELERIIRQFWWKRRGVRKGFHWSDWSTLCGSKDSGGMDFQNFAHFNVVLLAKRG